MAGCGDDIPDAAQTMESLGATGTELPDTTGGTEDTGEPTTGGDADVHELANGCYSVHTGDQNLAADGEDAYAFSGGATSRFFFKAADLGTYLLYDENAGYVVAEDGPLIRATTLESDVTLIDDDFVSGALWELQPLGEGYRLRHVASDRFLGTDGLTSESGAAEIFVEPAQDCAEHPELSLDAEGQIAKTTFDDGDLYGIVDTHSHILSNFAFGGGGIFHGAPFHPLGVAHALPDCALYHGENGRRDFFGYAFDNAGSDSVDLTELLPAALDGELDQDNHATAGWPDFTEWPAGPDRSTHQTQYYRWLERAWLAGLRLVVQHATTNSVICEFTVGQGIQEVRYSCNDMVAVDRIVDETYALERYIDAQAGGPGLGFFRIVTTPAQAREVIAEGKMAVILGIETSNLFDCFIAPRADAPVCDEAWVIEQLDAYYERGVRAIFPVHKYDNGFSAGDGDRAFIEFGNFFNSWHWSNFTLDCPTDVPAVFDQGTVELGGLNMPRDDYDGTPPHDFSGFAQNPLGTAFPFITALSDPPLEGPYCQNAGLTDLGETLVEQMMMRGMIIEIDHLPQRAYERMYELLEAADYPAAATHGSNWDGRLYALGGVSKTGLGRCRDPERPGAMLDRLGERVALIEANGGYPAEGFGFDLNGFAGAPRARFAEGACPTEQTDPITYPFDSYAGDVTFTEPQIGNRTVDFNTEGMVHIGLLPELLQDARGDAVSDEDLEPLFRSAEAYLRMWEKASTGVQATGLGAEARRRRDRP